jgi:hypothetical protein
MRSPARTIRAASRWGGLGLATLLVAIAATTKDLPGRPVVAGHAAAAVGITECGTLAATTTWSPANSPISICPGGVTVPAGGTLTVNASKGNVQVDALGAGGITVYGSLQTSGNLRFGVTFTGPTATAGSWAGITFVNETVSPFRSGSGSIDYTAIKDAVTGLTFHSSASNLTGGFGLLVANSTIDLSTTGVSVVDAGKVSVADTSISHTTTGVHTQNSQLTISNTTIDQAVTGISGTDANVAVHGGTLSNISGVGIDYVTQTDWQVVIDGMTFASIAKQAIRYTVPGLPEGTCCGPGRPTVSVTNNIITAAGTAAPGYATIEITNAQRPALSGNRISSSSRAADPSTRRPVITLNGTWVNLGNVVGQQSVFGNTGNGNGVDAIGFAGSYAINDFSWLTPHANALATDPLGYVISYQLDVVAGKTMTVGAGDVVKVGGGAMLQLNGGHLVATAGAIFTSVADSSFDVDRNLAVTCPTGLAVTCNPTNRAWGGIRAIQGNGLNGSSPVKGDVSLSGSTIRFAGGIGIYSGASSLPGGFGLALSNSVVDHSFSGVYASLTDISVSDSTFTSLAGAAVTAVNGGHPTLVTNNQIDAAGTNASGAPAIDLSSTNVTVGGNRVTGSSAGTGVGGIRYPAIKITTSAVNLANVAGQPSVYGNTGNGNGINAIQLDGGITVNSSFSWQSVRANALATDPLGYIATGNLTLAQQATLTVGPNDLVRVTGTISLPGAHLVATGGGAAFTSVRDASFNVAPWNGQAICPTSIVADCNPTAGNWGGISIGDVVVGTTTVRGDAALAGATVRYANTGIAISSSSRALTGGAGLLFSAGRIENAAGSAIAVGSAARAAISSSRLVNNGGTTIYAIDAPGSVSVDCSSIHGNGGGLSAEGADTSVNNGDLFMNAGTNRYDVSAVLATAARNDWWGQSTGPSAGQIGGTGAVDTSGFLATQAPSVSIALSSDNTRPSGAFGKGTVTAVLSFSRKMDPGVAPSVAVLTPNSHSLTGAWQADSLTWIGTYTLDPATDTSGARSLTVSGARSCVPEPTTNLMAQASKSFVIDYTTGLFFPALMNHAFGGYTTTVYLQNVSGGSLAAGAITLVYYDATGAAAGSGDSSPALVDGQVWLIRQDNGHSFASGAAGSGRVNSAVPLVAFVNQEIGSSDGSSYSALPEAATGATVFAPAVLNNAYGGYTTGIALTNAGTQSTTVTVTYHNADGTAVSPPRSQALAPNAFWALYQGEASTPLPSGFAGTATITTNPATRLAVIVNEVNGAGGQFLTYTAANAGATRLNAPVALNNAYGGYNTGMGIQNVGSTTAHVSITYSGVLTPETFDILAGGSRGTYNGGGASNPVLPDGFHGSATISSDQPLVEIVNEVKDGATFGTSYNTFAGGAAIVHLPLVENAFNGFSTGLGVENVGSGAATVTIVYTDPNSGAQVGTSPTLTLQPGEFVGVYQGPGGDNGVPSGTRAAAVLTVTNAANGGRLAVIVNQQSATSFMSYSGQ